MLCHNAIVVGFCEHDRLAKVHLHPIDNTRPCGPAAEYAIPVIGIEQAAHGFAAPRPPGCARAARLISAQRAASASARITTNPCDLSVAICSSALLIRFLSDSGFSAATQMMNI